MSIESSSNLCVVAFVRNLASRDFIRGEVGSVSGELVKLSRLKDESSRRQALCGAVVVMDLADYTSTQEITEIAKEAIDAKARAVIGIYPHIRVDLVEAFTNSSLFSDLIPRSKFMRTFRDILLSYSA